MNQIKEITDALVDFRDRRNWQQFHNPKDLAVALSIEASELNELFLWKKSEKELEEIPVDEIAEELADVFAYAFLLADRYKMDVKKIVQDKIEKNEIKYPVDSSYNNSTKYNRLK